MLDAIRALLILQDRDRRLLAIAKDLEKIPQEEARAKSKLAGDEAAVKKAHDELMEAGLKVKKAELDAQTRRTTITRLKMQQFETRKNDEFQAIKHEITRYEAELDAFETKELEAMEEVDQFRIKFNQAEAALAITKGLVNEDLARISERKARDEAERKELVEERTKLAVGISDEILPLYERLMRSKDGLALAPLNEGKCGGCHMKLIASTVINVQSEQQITRCEDCGRILYVEG
jgi:predicted  nucleic acid-binding Zn-ribbon protein